MTRYNTLTKDKNDAHDKIQINGIQTRGNGSVLSEINQELREAFKKKSRAESENGI